MRFVVNYTLCLTHTETIEAETEEEAKALAAMRQETLNEQNGYSDNDGGTFELEAAKDFLGE